MHRFMDPRVASARLLVSLSVAAALVVSAAGVAVAQGEMETDTLRLGHRTNDIGASAPIWVAKDKGFYADNCGGLNVEVNLIDEVDAALIGGSLDIMIFDPDNTASHINAGVPLVMIAGWREKEPLIMGTTEGIASVEDLAGTDVALGLGPGDTATNFRLASLKAAGWDLEALDPPPNFVNPPGFSNGRVELLKEGILSLTYFFPRHKSQVADANGMVIIDDLKEETGDVVVATRDTLAAMPNVLACFIAQTINGKAFVADEANKDEVVAIVAANDVPAEPKDVEPWNAHYNTHSQDMAIIAVNLAANLSNSGVDDPGYDALTDLSALEAAWALLGMEGRAP